MKRKKLGRSILVTLLVSTMTLSLLSSCGSSDTAKDNSTSSTSSASSAVAAKSDEKAVIRISWWGNQVRNDGTVKALDLYTKENPNVTFETEFSDWNGYWDKMSTQAASGTLPDIIQQDYGYIKQYQEKNQIISLNKYAENKSLDLTNVAENVINSGSIDGKLYALCMGMNTKAILYDVDVVKKAGVTLPEQPTWDEFLDICNTIYKSTGKKFTIPSNDEQTMLFIGRSKGEKFFDGTKLGMKDSSTALRYFTMLNDTLKSGAHVAPEIIAEASTNQKSLFAAGTVWCEITNSNMIVNSISQVKDKINYDIAMFPKEKDSVQQPLFIKPSMFLCITSNSKLQDQSARVLNFITNSTDANNILLGERGVPISKVVSEAIKPKLDTVTANITKYVEKVAEIAAPIDPPSPAGAGEVGKLISDLADQVRYEKIKPQAAADKFYKDANDILAKSAE